jgi:TonB-dependent receptor
MSVSPISGNPISSYKGGATFPHTFLWSDSRKFFAKYSLADLAAIPGAVTRNPAVASRVNEDVDAAYVRFDFGSDDGRWSGNVGTRYERTKGSATFYGVDFSNIVYDSRPSCDQICAQANQTLNASLLKSDVSKYGQWLPSFNFKYSITDELIARIGASKEMTRPDLDVLIGGEAVQMLQTPATGGNPITTINSGNPDVKPYLANALDASLEWYFSREGLLSAAFFHKDVSNWVFTSQTDEVHTIKLAQGGTKDYTFLRTLPQNGGGVKITGFELSYQQPFTFLPEELSGFGFVGNYTYVKTSDIINKATGERTPVTGVSKNSYNASLYYENYGFNARLSYNYHQGRIEQVRDYWSVSPTYSKSYGQFDLSTGYQINDLAQVTFSVINLMNKPNFVGYAENTGLINDYYQEGRIVQLGLHVKL